MELASNGTPDFAASIPALIAQRASMHAAKTILRRKDRGIWKAVSWSQLADQVKAIGEALLACDLGRGGSAAIMSETKPEAVYADLAIQGTGAASIMIHPEEDADRIGHILQSTGCRLVFVESEEQLDRILTVRDRCPALVRIVIFDMKGLREFSDQACVSLASFVTPSGAAGRSSAADWSAAVNAVMPDQPAVMLFPRDEPRPQGRVLTHREVLQMVAGARARLPLRPNDERLAVLRLADLEERVWGLYVALDAGCISNYLESPDTAAENLQELQPTVLGADAEAWAHLHGRASRFAKAATATQRMAYEWALRAGRHGSPRGSPRGSPSGSPRGGLGSALANLLVLRAVRRELGLNKLRLAYVGGGPVSAATQDWANCLGITIHRIDEPVPTGHQPDARHHSLMQGAPA
ncbi:AMP-binding protein [Rhodopila sp.]|uniref:AMP-binding protein n=1 Tax=Rhodopila sp. TaxID=2480087 RepID=UPI003D098DE3